MQHWISRKYIACLLVLSAWSTAAYSDDQADLQLLLNGFLDGAADVEVHQRFWSSDLVYTSSTGKRFGKKEIIEGMLATQAEPEVGTGTDTAAVKYHAENTDIRLYGDFAVVAFELVATESNQSDTSNTSKSRYFNTGTFSKRSGEWQAVAWQATKIPSPAD
ncbi:nuclear transport factor 2 family protein [Microbulbifer sp. SA54]|uniref:nuclear transport factor 2 family protein n=1 Tax=Microbulbifer sp. SA54 TaxID=3401577 RepID=UPI003AAF53AA